MSPCSHGQNNNWSTLILGVSSQLWTPIPQWLLNIIICLFVITIKWAYSSALSCVVPQSGTFCPATSYLEFIIYSFPLSSNSEFSEAIHFGYTLLIPFRNGVFSISWIVRQLLTRMLLSVCVPFTFSITLFLDSRLIEGSSFTSFCCVMVPD